MLMPCVLRANTLFSTSSWNVFLGSCVQEYWQLYLQNKAKRKSWVVLCLFMDGRKTTGTALENFTSARVVCCCQNSFLSHGGCASPPWKAVFLSFQWFSSRVFCFFVESSPTGSALSLFIESK